MPLLWLFLLACVSFAADAPKPGTDTILFDNGEKLVGHLVRSTGAKVTFKSDSVGEITVNWSKVKELHSGADFAVVRKDVQLRRAESAERIPLGKVIMREQKLEVAENEGKTETVPVPDSAYVIDSKTFERSVVQTPGVFQDWKGTVGAGATLVEATQHSRAFNGSIALVRAVPEESWLDRRNRTTIDFSAAYGLLTQPGSPQLKTEIYHADAERDQYFSPRLYSFAQAFFDHNFSQGLDLAQNFGGGIGLTVIKTANENLDLKSSVSYVKQQFASVGVNQDLIASTLAESYARKLGRGVQFNQQLSITPAWNNLQAYSGNGSAALTMPVYKRLNFTIGAFDTFLNDPPQGYKKNSFQFTTGLTYALP